MEWSNKVHLCHILLVAIFALVFRKIWIGHIALGIVASCREQILTEKIVSNEEFLKVARTMSDTEPTLIFIFNQYAFNMTMNWLCNTISMRDVHARTVLVTLDRVSYDNIGLIWPNITRFYWNVTCLERPFNYGDGYYQLFFLFRSNLAQAFLKLGKPFWMAQQDTFWRKSIFDLKLDDAQKEADIIFDKASDSALPLIAGRSFITKWPYERGHYKVRPTCGSRTFFKQLSADLEHQYAPDNTYMSALCAHLAIINCEFIPFQKIANWMWLYEKSTQLAEVPYLLQFDGERKLGGKLAAMKELGFYFLNKDALTCNASAVSEAMKLVSKRKSADFGSRSFSRFQFQTYQTLLDLLHRFRLTERFLNRIVLPYAHYFMLTI